MTFKQYSLVLRKPDLRSFLRVTKTHEVDDLSMNTPQSIYRVCESCLGLSSRAEEYVYMIAVNTKCRIIGMFCISKGSVCASILDPRSVFIRALLVGACSIILVHNHPSQDTEPSRDDRTTTKRLKEVGDILGLKVLDHIIVGDSGYYSFKEHNEI